MIRFSACYGFKYKLLNSLKQPKKVMLNRKTLTTNNANISVMGFIHYGNIKVL